MSLLLKSIKPVLIVIFMSFAGLWSIYEEGTAFGKILFVFSDEELVKESDIIIVGEQVDAITVKIKDVIKGTYQESEIELERLPEYSRDIINKEGAVQTKLSSTEVILFINGRTVPYSLVSSGVKRFSSEGDRHILFSYVVAGDKDGYKLIVDPESAAKENYIEDIKYLSMQAAIEYKIELKEYLKNLDTSTRDTTRPFIVWARQNTRWGYTEGINALLTISKDFSTDAYLDAVWALREIRDPYSSKPLMEYINANVDEKVLFDHICAVGAIGGADVLSFLTKLSTYDETQKKVNCGAIHGLRLLYPQLQIKSKEAETLIRAVLPKDYDNVPVCMREALVSIANDETFKALQLYTESKKIKDDNYLYNDAMNMLQKLQEKIKTDKEYEEKMVLLKTKEW